MPRPHTIWQGGTAELRVGRTPTSLSTFPPPSPPPSAPIAAPELTESEAEGQTDEGGGGGGGDSSNSGCRVAEWIP
jgi:hypothetical protein